MVQITDKTKQAFDAAADKLGRTKELPIVSMLPAGIALYLTAIYMLTTIIEARKHGKVFDITNHSVRKYSPWAEAENGYVPGSSSGGFSCIACDADLVCTRVGARLSSNSREDAKEIFNEHIDLYEIIMLNVEPA